MYRIDDNTYIDTSLITCPEYQLFIDEMLAQKKYFQPDHWKTYQFPKDQAHSPIFGVRPSDAVAFCDWLTQRENSQWQYRLPTQEEADQFPIELLAIAPSGFWIMQSKMENSLSYICSKQDRILFENNNFIWINHKALVKFPIDLDFALVCDRALDRLLALDSVFDLDSAIVLDADLARARILARDRDQAIAITIARARDRDLARVLSRHLDLVLARDRALTLDRDLTRDRDLARDIIRTLEHDFDLVDVLDRTRNLDFDLDDSVIDHENRVLKLARVRALYIVAKIVNIIKTSLYLQLLGLRINNDYQAFEGIRIVKERKPE